MAQGNHGKLSKAKAGTKRSAGSQRRKAVKAVKLTRKGSTKMENNLGVVAATKAINKKNERIIAAKACVGGTHFFLKDIVEKGKRRACLCCAPSQIKHNMVRYVLSYRHCSF